LYHSAECRRKARRLRHESRATDTADLPAEAAASASPATTPPGTALPATTPRATAPPTTALPTTDAPPPELTRAEPVAAAELPAAELPVTAEPHDMGIGPEAVRPPAAFGAEAKRDAIGPPEAFGASDTDEDPDEDPGDSAFWSPGHGEADGFWDADDEPPRQGARSPGRHRSVAGQRSRLRRSHVAAIAVTLAASAVGLGLVFSQSSPHHPLASDAQLHPPGLGSTQPASSSSSAPAGHPRHTHSHTGGGTSHAPGPPATSPPPATKSRAPSPTPSRTSSPPSPKPSRSPKRTQRVPAGLISFENGTDGWKRMYGSIHSAQSTWVAYSGSHSLRITLSGDDAAVGVENSSIRQLRPGDSVTFHIYSDGQSGGRVGVWAETMNQPEDVVETVPLPTHRGWFTLTWTVPSVSRVDVIGVQVAHQGGGKLTLAIDALSWTGS
jgi:hypothetical protein